MTMKPKTPPVVIPKERMDPNKQYRGYVAYSDGLVRHDKAPFKVVDPVGDPSGEGQELHLKPTPSLRNHDWGVSPVRRRTPQERVISLANRILAQYQKGGLTEDVFKEVQTVCWELGIPATFEDAAALARRYLEKAEMEKRIAEQHQVVRQSPYVLNPGNQGETEPPVIRAEEEQTA